MYPDMYEMDMMTEEMLTNPLFLGIFVAVLLISMAISVLFYVFRSIGLYTIAKRRQINNPWLAWIPLGDSWILGSISDQYQYVVKRKNKSKRKLLLILQLVLLAMSAVMIAGYVYSSVMVILDRDIPMSAIRFLSVSTSFSMPMYAVAIVTTVIRFIALYDLYNSCNPQSSAVYLVLSILVDVTEPFLVFACRKQDQGMPPRKTEQPNYIPPVEVSGEHTPREERDPWDNVE